MMNTEPLKQKILIIDDDPMDINILRSILEADYSLNIAINGKMGLKRAQLSIAAQSVPIHVHPKCTTR
ncbi:MAG: hypothetical protein HQL90_12435, partial [Magnetococcales bacterium]|nr:hypothetical protein [Magnetococcales bacterium]